MIMYIDYRHIDNNPMPQSRADSSLGYQKLINMGFDEDLSMIAANAYGQNINEAITGTYFLQKICCFWDFCDYHDYHDHNHKIYSSI